MIFLTKRNDNGVAVIDGIDSTANVLSLIHPAFAGLTIITFVIKQIINYVCTDDIVKRINKIEQQLNNKKINIEEFKEKITNLTEHNMYVVRNNLSNILLNCIPDTVDIYISIWIDLIMSDTNSANDLLLLEMIKTFMKYGEKRYYISSEMTKRNRVEERKKENEEIREYNSKTKGIKKLDFRFSDRDIRIGNKTIFWKDFSKFYNVNVGEMGYMILDKGINENGEKTMNWAYYVRSFIKLDRLGVLQLDYHSTLGTVNALNIALFGEKLLEYIPLKRKNTYDMI